MKHFLRLVAFFILLLSEAGFASNNFHYEIKGISGNPLKNAQERLNLLQQSYGSDLTKSDIQDFNKSAPQNIRKALEPYGYFKSEVQSELNHTDSGWLAEYRITPGPTLKISSVEVKLEGAGENNEVLQKFIAHFPLQENQPLKIELYEKTIQDLFEIANNQGYLKAKFNKKEIRIDLKKYEAKIILHFSTGQRFYFGDVTFEKSPFAQSFLNRFVPFEKDQPFSNAEVLKLQQNLSNSRYFKEVAVDPQFQNEKDNKVPVDVKVIAPKSQQYNIGAGYGTFTGPRLTLGMNLRRTTDTGQHFNAQLKLSPVLSGLAAKYFIPGKNPLTDEYTLGANYQKFVPKNGQSYSQTLSAGYVKNENPWQSSLTTNYLTERYQVEENPTRSSHFLYPALSISRIKADDLIWPTKGTTFTFNLQGANQNILSTTSFFQTELKGKAVFSPTNASRIIARGDLGYTVVKNLDQLPLTMNFFAGGLGSVRGYPFSSIGPGRYLEVASVELQHRLYGDLNGAIFYDIGTATDHFNKNFNRGVGIGFVYKSMIGPIQLYVAKALDSTGKPTRIEFNIGTDF